MTALFSDHALFHVKLGRLVLQVSCCVSWCSGLSYLILINTNFQPPGSLESFIEEIEMVHGLFLTKSASFTRQRLQPGL